VFRARVGARTRWLPDYSQLTISGVVRGVRGLTKKAPQRTGQVGRRLCRWYGCIHALQYGNHGGQREVGERFPWS